MNYLLDTRPFLLWASDSEQLPKHVETAIRSFNNEIFVSLATMREMQVKSQIGMLDLPVPVRDIFEEQQEINHIKMIPIDFKSMLMLPKLPNHHHDPFDRLILAQALAYDLTIITNDPLIKQYKVKMFW